MAKKESASLGDPKLTLPEYQKILNLMQAKTVKVGAPVEYQEWQMIEKKLLDHLSGPGLDLD